MPRFIFEGHCCEFIGLLCYLAERGYRRQGVHLGAVEKMIAIAHDHLDVVIPEVESTIGPRGTLNLYRPSTVVAASQSFYLRDIQSRYFWLETRGRQHFFRLADGFVQNLRLLTARDYYDEYESAGRALVEMWSVIGYSGLMLIDMLAHGDGGIKFLVADLEFALRNAWGFLSASSDSGNVARPDEWRLRFENSLDAYRDKIKAIEESALKLELAKASCTSPKAQVLLTRLKPADAVSPLMGVVQCLYEDVKRVGLMIFSSEPPEVISGVVRRLRDVVAGGEEAKIVVGRDDRETAFRMFCEMAERWFRALAGRSRVDEAASRTIANVQGARVYSAVCDIRGFSTRLRESERQHGSLMEPVSVEWFRRICAIVRGWWLLFGGTLSNTAIQEGDLFFASFKHGWQAIEASALAVSHLQMLQRYADESTSYEVKVAVGRGEPTVSYDGVDLSTVGNRLFHMTKRLAERKDLARNAGSILLGHVSLFEDNLTMKAHITEAIDGEGSILDPNAISKSFLARLRSV